MLTKLKIIKVLQYLFLKIFYPKILMIHFHHMQMNLAYIYDEEAKVDSAINITIGLLTIIHQPSTLLNQKELVN